MTISRGGGRCCPPPSLSGCGAGRQVGQQGAGCLLFRPCPHYCQILSRKLIHHPVQPIPTCKRCPQVPKECKTLSCTLTHQRSQELRVTFLSSGAFCSHPDGSEQELGGLFVSRGPHSICMLLQRRPHSPFFLCSTQKRCFVIWVHCVLPPSPCHHFIRQDFKKIPLHMGTLIHYKLAFERADKDHNG